MMALPAASSTLAARACCWRTLFTPTTPLRILLRRAMATSTAPATPSTTSSTTPPRSSIPIHFYDIHPTRRPYPSSFHGQVVLPPPKKIPILPPPGPPPHPTPLDALTAQQIQHLDPTSVKTRLLSRTRDGLRPGDILQVRFSHRDPFSGILLQLRRRGVDSALLLRNQLTRVGVEMWVKLYNPNVLGVDLVQRARSRARRARLYYLRMKNKDFGSVQNIVAAYVRQRTLLRSGAVRKAGSPSGGQLGKKK